MIQFLDQQQQSLVLHSSSFLFILQSSDLFLILDSSSTFIIISLLLLIVLPISWDAPVRDEKAARDLLSGLVVPCTLAARVLQAARDLHVVELHSSVSFFIRLFFIQALLLHFDFLQSSVFFIAFGYSMLMGLELHGIWEITALVLEHKLLRFLDRLLGA